MRHSKDWHLAAKSIVAVVKQPATAAKDHQYPKALLLVLVLVLVSK
jgi:hypothetical protein